MSTHVGLKNGLGAVEVGDPTEKAGSWNPIDFVWWAGRHFSEWLFNTQSYFHEPNQASQFLQAPGKKTPLDTSRPHTPQPCKRYGLTVTAPLSNPPKPNVDRGRYSAPGINSLPIELLGEVFYHYIHDHTRQKKPAPRRWMKTSPRIAAHTDASTTPMLLGHVCSRWRSISLSMPTLWTSICAIGPEPRHVSLFLLWLERSKSCPLDITITQCGGIHQGGSPAIRDILSSAMVQIDRWRSLTLDILDDGEDLFSDTTITASNLEMFSLNLKGWKPLNIDGLRRVLYTSPALRRVNWGPSLEDAMLEGAPWEQLTHIEINHLVSVKLFSVLPHCHSLVHLSVITIDSRSDYDHQDVVLLPHLRHLDLHYLDDASFIFDCLTVPSLISMNLSQGFGFTCCINDGWSSLTNLLIRSECELQSFSWLEGYPEEALLMSNISSPIMKTLKNLTITSKISDKTLAALTLDEGDGVLPHLETLSLGDCDSVDGNLSVMILSRIFNDSTSLKHVSANLRGAHPLDLSLCVSDVTLNLHLLC